MPPKLECVLPSKLQKSDCPSRFFNRFEIACNCMEWTEEGKKARQVLLLLGDDVFDYAYSLPETTRNNYTNLKKAIITKYEVYQGVSIDEVEGGRRSYCLSY